MRTHHTPYHWVLVALVLLALLLTFGEAHGQSAGAAAVFEGRPAMAGAQAGLGAQSGPPQGGIGLQGTEAAERALHLRRPAAVADMPQGSVASSGDVAGFGPNRIKPRDEAVEPKDSGLARGERSAVKKSKRAVKRTLERSRTGVGGIDSTARAGG